MNPCEKYAALLDAFVDGELAPEELAAVREHLERCPACRSYVDDALAIRAAFPDVEETEVPEGFAASVSAAIRDRTPAGGGRKRRAPWLRAALPLAACCALVILLSRMPGSPLRFRNAASQGMTADTAAPASAEAPMGESAMEDAAEAPEAPEESGAEEWKSLTEGFSPSSVQSPGAQLDTAGAGAETGLPAESGKETNNQSSSDLADPVSPAGSNNAPQSAEAPAAAPVSGKAAEDAAQKGRTVPASETEPEESVPAVTAARAEEDWVQYGNVVFAAVVCLPRDGVGDALDGYEGRPYSDANSLEKGVIGTGYALEREDFRRILEEAGYSAEPVLNQDRTTELCCIVVTGE